MSAIHFLKCKISRGKTQTNVMIFLALKLRLHSGCINLCISFYLIPLFCFNLSAVSVQGRRPIFHTKLPFLIVGNTFILSRAHFYRTKRTQLYLKNHQLCLRFYKCKGSVQKEGQETDLLVQISMTKSFHCWLIFYQYKYKNDFMGEKMNSSWQFTGSAFVGCPLRREMAVQLQ